MLAKFLDCVAYLENVSRLTQGSSYGQKYRQETKLVQVRSAPMHYSLKYKQETKVAQIRS